MRFRLADEYDAAQERGEIGSGNGRNSNPEIPHATSVMSPKEIHEARLIRDAEKAEPGKRKRPSLWGRWPRIRVGGFLDRLCQIHFEWVGSTTAT